MHFNDVKLLLSFSLSGPLYVVVEFAPNGNLRQFLRKRRPTREIATTLTALRDRRPVRENGSTVTYMDLVSFSYQVCRGMEYLSSKKVCVKMWYFSDDCRNKWASYSHHALHEISDLVEFGLKTKNFEEMCVRMWWEHWGVSDVVWARILFQPNFNCENISWC